MAGHICCVRKNASRGGNKVTLPRSVLKPLPSAGVSFCSCEIGVAGSQRPAGAPKEEGRPSRWKDGLARSFVHCNRPVQ